MEVLVNRFILPFTDLMFEYTMFYFGGLVLFLAITCAVLLVLIFYIFIFDVACFVIYMKKSKEKKQCDKTQ